MFAKGDAVVHKNDKKQKNPGKITGFFAMLGFTPNQPFAWPRANAYVAWQNGRHTLTSADKLVAYKKEEKVGFAKGDRVEILGGDSAYGDQFKGKMGTVLGLDEYSSGSHRVAIDGDLYEWRTQDTKTLRLIKPATAAPHVFAVGDEVEILWKESNHYRHTGTIDDVPVASCLPYYVTFPDGKRVPYIASELRLITPAASYSFSVADSKDIDWKGIARKADAQTNALRVEWASWVTYLARDEWLKTLPNLLQWDGTILDRWQNNDGIITNPTGWRTWTDGAYRASVCDADLAAMLAYKPVPEKPAKEPAQSQPLKVTVRSMG
jgi:hypothetical protein